MRDAPLRQARGAKKKALEERHEALCAAEERKLSTNSAPREGYLSSFWAYFEVSLFAVAALDIALRVYVQSAADSYSIDFGGTNATGDGGPTDFVDLRPYATIYETSVGVSTVLLVCALLQTISLFALNPHLSFIYRALARASASMLNYLAAATCVYLAFCVFAFLLFNNSSSDFATFGSSMAAVISMAQGSLNYEPMNQASTLTPLYYFFFIPLGYFIIPKFFVAILYSSYHAQSEEVRERGYFWLEDPNAAAKQAEEEAARAAQRFRHPLDNPYAEAVRV